MADQAGLPETAADLVGRWPVDWDNFVLECPWAAGTAGEWKEPRGPGAQTHVRGG